MVEQRINKDDCIRDSFWDLVVEYGSQCRSKEDKQNAAKKLSENFDWCISNEWHEGSNGICFTLEVALSEWHEKTKQK